MWAHPRAAPPPRAKPILILLAPPDAMAETPPPLPTARPLQAALFSAVSFAIGAALPLLTAWAAPFENVMHFTASASLIFLAVLGAVAAHAGGASLIKGSLRVLFWGAIAMAATALVGNLFGTAVG